jgi:hypothetical protein
VRFNEMTAVIPGDVPAGAPISVFAYIVGEQGLAKILIIKVIIAGDFRDRHPLDNDDDGLGRWPRQVHARLSPVKLLDARTREVQNGDDWLSRPDTLVREGRRAAFAKGDTGMDRLQWIRTN